MNNSNNLKHEIPMLIGLHGVAQSGKDTAGQVLQKIGFKRVGFADKLREDLYRLNPLVKLPVSLIGEWLEKFDAELDVDVEEHYTATDDFSEEVFAVMRLADLVNAIGWDEAKRAPEVRELMQRRGDEAGRQLYGETFWIDQGFEEMGTPQAGYFSDVRYDNEAERINAAGGFVIEIIRPGFEPVNGHASDSGINPELIKVTVSNDGTIEELHKKVLTVIGELATERLRGVAEQIDTVLAENFLG